MNNVNGVSSTIIQTKKYSINVYIFPVQVYKYDCMEFILTVDDARCNNATIYFFQIII